MLHANPEGFSGGVFKTGGPTPEELAKGRFTTYVTAFGPNNRSKCPGLNLVMLQLQASLFRLHWQFWMLARWVLIVACHYQEHYLRTAIKYTSTCHWSDVWCCRWIWWFCTPQCDLLMTKQILNYFYVSHSLHMPLQMFAVLLPQKLFRHSFTCYFLYKVSPLCNKQELCHSRIYTPSF